MQQVSYWQPYITFSDKNTVKEKPAKKLSAFISKVKEQSSPKTMPPNPNSSATPSLKSSLIKPFNCVASHVTSVPDPNLETPQISPNITREMCELKQWGLPREVLTRYHEAGITHMFAWQAECLSLDGVLSGKNLVYCAPTSAGKTLVAELLLLKRVLETKQKVLFILPFVSVAGEKTAYLKGILEGTGLRIGGFFGTKGPPGGISKVDVAVCTIEKGNGIVNRMIEKEELGEIGCVVVDEVHMVGDSSRGYLLELLLTKLLYQSRHNASALQIVGMSATLPNLDLLSRWLDAALYTTDFRPVPLTQYVKTGNVLQDTTGAPVRQLPPHPHDHLVFLCLETLQGGHNVLVFAPNKAWTERLCEIVAGSLYKEYSKESSCLDKDGLNEIVSQLERLPMTLDPVLARTVRCGIAYHHAGLTIEEREVVESGFRRGIIRVLIATTTLSAGVNLPARRVIIRSPKAGPNYMTPLLYQQMSGRAGRMGVDEAGESVLIYGPREANAVGRIVSNVLDPVSSCLGGASLGTAMKRAMLEIIAGGMVSSEEEVTLYFQCTLLAAEQKHNQDILNSALEFLKNFEFITEELSTDGGKVYKATKLGSGTLNSSLPPNEALELLTHLQKARRNFNLETELQLVYEVTPLSFYKTWAAPDWYNFYKIWCSLLPAYRRAGENVGVDEGYLACASSRTPQSRTDSQKLLLQVHLRFFAALALLEVIEEVPIDQIATRFSTNRGQLQSLQSSASSYAGQVSVFCQRLGFSALGLLLSDLQVRLFSGVNKELCDLVRVQLITGPLARVLYNSGYTGVVQLSAAQPETILTVLEGVLPFKSEQELEGGRSWLAKRHGLTELEAAANIIENAKELLQDDLCQMNVQVNLTDILKRNNSANTTNALYRSVIGSKQQSSTDEKSVNVSVVSNNKTIESSSKDCADKNDYDEPIPVNKSISALEIPDILSPHTPRKSVLLRASSDRRKSRLDEMCSDDVLKASSKQESSNRLDISSQFDEFNLSAWDFLDIDKDLLAMSDKDSKIPSPKRKTISPRKSSSKKLKPGSPSKSPLKFRKNCDMPITSPIQKVLNFEDDNQFSLDSMEVMRGPSEVISLDETLPPVVSNHKISSVSACAPIQDTTYVITGNKSLRSPLKNIATQTNCVDQIETKFSIIDVVGNDDLFEAFLEELKSKSQYSITVAWDQLAKLNSVHQSFDSSSINHCFEDAVVAGIAFSWGDMDSYYVKLSDKKLDISSCTPAAHPEVSLDRRVKALTEVLQLNSLDETASDTSFSESMKYQRIGFDIKSQWKLLASSFDITIDEELRDCKIAAWILDPDSVEPSLISLVSKYIPEIAEKCGMKDSSAPLLGTSRMSSCLDAILVWHLHEALDLELKKKGLLVPYREVECPLIRVLARMELNGMGFSKEEFNTQYRMLKTHLDRLERLAHKLYGTKFSLSSLVEVSDVLFNKLRLPPHDPNKPIPKLKNRRKFFSTSKDVLTRISPLHPLPSVIILWRKITAALNKTMDPLENSGVLCQGLNMFRIYTNSITHSATGRVSFHLPNLQNINRSFVLDFPEQIKATDPRFEPLTACPRTMFLACEGCVLLAADYSQLELRLICHLSGDKKLRILLNNGGDVFRAIAAEVNQCDVTDVTDQQRQRAKQICYGILYGMGAQSLAQELECPEKDASEFMEKFKNKYSGLKKYIKKTVSDCQTNGYVETILHRLRYLPDITSANVMLRAKAERQSVNTTTQGSGADVVKVAMVNIDRILQSSYPDAVKTNTQRRRVLVPALEERVVPSGAYLVLQLHDELIYEVRL